MKKRAAPTRLTGTRIRERRMGAGLKQAELARRVGISPAYLNLIEHNRRPIAGKLLIDIARQLRVDPADLSEGAEAALAGVLTAAAMRQPDSGAEVAQVGEFVGRFAGWAGLLAAQHRRMRELERLVEALSDRLTHDPQLAATLHEVLSTVTAIRAAVQILSDGGGVDPDWQARFLRNMAEDTARLSEAAQGLAQYLEAGDEAAGSHQSPLEELTAFLEGAGHVFAALEPGGGGDIAAIVEGAPVLASRVARDLARRWLERYREDAAALPWQVFRARWRGDPLALADALGVPLDRVLRRAAVVLGAGGSDGPGVGDDAAGPGEGAGPGEEDAGPGDWAGPGDRAGPGNWNGAPAGAAGAGDGAGGGAGDGGGVGLVICDGSGTFTLRRAPAGFAVPRFGAACPRWPLFQALAQPGRPVVAMVEMPGGPGRLFACHAQAVARWPEGAQGPAVIEATMLILPAAGGARAGGGAGAGAVLKVGPGCRVCPRAHCPARREMSLLAPEAEG